MRNEREPDPDLSNSDRDGTHLKPLVRRKGGPGQAMVKDIQDSERNTEKARSNQMRTNRPNEGLVKGTNKVEVGWGKAILLPKSPTPSGHPYTKLPSS